MNHTLLDQEHRDFWGRVAHEQNPEFWFTFDYKRRYGDAESISGFKFALKAIQRKIPSPRTLRGMASIERTWKSAAFDGCLHIHTLLWGLDATLRNPDAYLRDLAYKSVLRLTDSKGRQMADLSTINVQRVYEPEGVIKYATKDIYRRDTRRRSRIWLIRPSGLDVSTDYFN